MALEIASLAFWLHHPVDWFLVGSGRLPMVRSRVVGRSTDVRPGRRVAGAVRGVRSMVQYIRLLQNHIGGRSVNLQY